METCKLSTIVGTKVENQTVKVFLSIEQSNMPLINGSDFKTEKFEGGVKDLVKVINTITRPFKDAPKNKCYLLITLENNEILEFNFLAGKFSFNLNTILNSFVQRKLIASNKNKVLAKAIKEDLNEILTEKINGFIQTLQFLQFVDKSPLYQITLGLTNLKLLSNNEAVENEL